MKTTRMNQQGFTLIELLVSVVIVVTIMSGVAGVFQTQSSLTVNNSDDMELQANVQGAMYIIRNSLLMAGFGVEGDSFLLTDSLNVPVSDSLVVYSAAKNSAVIQSFVLTAAPVVSSNVVPVYCIGDANTGERASLFQDVSLVPGMDTYLLFVNAFTGVKLTGIGTNPVRVTSIASPSCVPGDVDLNGDGVNDPVIEATLASSLTNVPRGATVYGYRGVGAVADIGKTTYSVDPVRLTLNQDGVPILWGVEDFQVQVQTSTGACSAAWCDSLAGVNQANITQIRFGLVVRTPHRHDLKPIDDVDNTFGHVPPAYVFDRKQFITTVRTRNNAF